MSQPLDFLDLIRQVRSGDETASADLVRQLRPFVQRVARIRMRLRRDYDRLRHDVGSSDVCQSVFRSLFRGLRENRYRLDQPGDLERLLQVMIRFHVSSKARQSSVRLRELIDEFEQGEWMASGPGPVQTIDQLDLIEAIQEQFSEVELELLTMWLDETSWAKIGEKIGCTAAAARVRLKRAVMRVRNAMGAEDHTGL